MATVAVPKTFSRGQLRSPRGAFGWRGQVRVETRPQAVKGLVNHRNTDRYTRKLAERAVDIARNHFYKLVVHSHPVTPPPYSGSFFVRPSVSNGASGGYVFGNDDPAAMWVEFGTHPGGGKTRTLGYRPLGYAIDQLSGKLNADFSAEIRSLKQKARISGRKTRAKASRSRVRTRRMKKLNRTLLRHFRKSNRSLNRSVKKFNRRANRAFKPAKMNKAFRSQFRLGSSLLGGTLKGAFRGVRIVIPRF